MKDYGIEILYYPGKVNVATKCLSRKTTHTSTLITKNSELQVEIFNIEIMVRGITDPPELA